MAASKHLTDYFQVITGQHRDPYAVLGMHARVQAGVKIVSVRVFRPDANEVNLVRLDTQEIWPMDLIHESGFFELIVPHASEVFEYELEIVTQALGRTRIRDPYSFLPVITDFDRHLFLEGTNYRCYEKFGARIMRVQGVEGTCFSVWAPHARRVSVVGDFNDWDGSVHSMRVLGSSGIWEIFIPGVGKDALYKYEIKTHDNYLVHKADPFGLYMQLPPETASRVWDLSGFEWSDDEWIKNRSQKSDLNRPMNVYEVHLGSWARDENNEILNYRELAHRLVAYAKEMGYTHLELLPVCEHPFYGSWGYQVIGYFAPSSRYGNPQDFMYFVNHCHENNISVILDWVPAHFPKDIHGLMRFDGTALYEHLDPRQGEHRDWGTLIFNYGRNEVVNFLISNLVYWCDLYHIDGFRIDAVASMLYLDYSRKEGEWIPNQFGGRENLEAIEFIRKANDVIHEMFPGVLTIAEESTSWPMVCKPTHLGGLGFDLKWNMGWMHDMLSFMSMDPIARKYHVNKVTFGLFYAFSENFMLVLSHDEVVHGKSSLLNKMPGDLWQKFANLRLFYGYMMAHPGKKLLFMGGEIGQQIEWNHDRELDWHLLDYPLHKGLNLYLKDLYKLYQDSSCLWEIDFEHHGFEWIDFSDAERTVVSFVRKTKNPWESLIFVFNFTPVPRRNYRVGMPWNGRYAEVMNSDSSYYSGSNLGNSGEIYSEDVWCQNQPYSAVLTLPPLGMLVLRPLDVPKTITVEGSSKPLRVYTMPEGIPMPEPKKAEAKVKIKGIAKKKKSLKSPVE
ncbi:MAG: 1,4-alpha-glucan branching protein GlgB [Candidatus Cloacimonetes bacterium]|nr:1,4-alpha-glucan branching protein GlgB [Candidatus Cloacimonadota bacterium]